MRKLLTGIKAEFSYKLKPKLPAQFKLAEAGGVPLAVILGDDAQEQGLVKVKEMGLPEGHPEKDGVLVKLSELVPRVRDKLASLAAGSKGVIGGELPFRTKAPPTSS